MDKAFFTVASPATLASLIRDIDGAAMRTTVGTAALRHEAWQALAALVGEIAAAQMTRSAR